MVPQYLSVAVHGAFWSESNPMPIKRKLGRCGFPVMWQSRQGWFQKICLLKAQFEKNQFTKSPNTLSSKRKLQKHNLKESA